MASCALSNFQCSLWSPSSSSFLISAFRWLMFSLLAFNLSFSSVISRLVLFFAASTFSLVFCSSSPTGTHKPWHGLDNFKFSGKTTHPLINQAAVGFWLYCVYIHSVSCLYAPSVSCLDVVSSCCIMAVGSWKILTMQRKWKSGAIQLSQTTPFGRYCHVDIPFHHRILRQQFSWALRWSRTGTASTNGTESPGTHNTGRLQIYTHNIRNNKGDQTYRPLIGIDEEDLDDDLKLSPARLCDLIGRFCNN